MTVINTNVKSLVAQASLAANNKNLSSAMERLSTGSRINSAKDDAAGLAISSRMTSQVRGLNMAIRNANDGISLAQTAEGAIEETTSMLQRMRELSLQAANTVNSAADRAALDAEVQQLKTEIDRIASTTSFNGQKILDGSFNGKLQIGAQASETMDLAIANTATTAMGETTYGLARTATKATLTVSGASTNVADYQGATFTATVNGTAKTVTLPVAAAGQQVNVAGATIAAASVGSDSAVDLTTSGQIGAVDQRTVDLSTAANAKLLVSLNGGTAQTIDISASSLYVSNTRATGEEIVSALQTKLDANAYFQGDNRLAVSLTESGRIKLALASGGNGTIAVSHSAGAALLNTLSGATTTLTTSGGSLEIGSQYRSFSGQTSFDVGSNHFDLTAAINARGYDVAELSGDQFVEVYNATAQVDGVQVSTATKTDLRGTITFTGALPSAPSNSPYVNGSMISVTTLSGATTTVFQDPSTGANRLGSSPVDLTDGNDETITIAVGGRTAVSLDIGSAVYESMGKLAEAIQSKIDASGAFTGDYAITVTATQDANKREGLTFTSATGKTIALSGDLLTGNNVTSGGATVTFAASTVQADALVSYDASSTTATIRGLDSPASIGNVFDQRTQSYSAAASRVFTLNVNGTGNVRLDFTDALTARGYTNSAMTGDQLVTVLNDTIAANGSFTGNNAVTASLTAEGQIKFQAAGGPAGGGNPSIVMVGSSSDFVGVTTAFNNGTQVTTSLTSDSSGSLVVSTAGDLEKFGVKDYVVSGARLGNNRVTLQVGASSAASFDVADGTYKNTQALVTEINSKISSSGLFTGANAVEAFAVVDTDSSSSTFGRETIGFRSTATPSQQVTLSGGLAFDMKVTKATANYAGTNFVDILAAKTKADASTGADRISFDYNGKTYSTLVANDTYTTALATALFAEATDSDGNALGAGKIVATVSGNDIELTLNQTSTSTALRSDSITNVVYEDNVANAVVLGSSSASTIASNTTYDDGDLLKFSYNGVAYTATLGTTTTGNDAAAINTAIDGAVDRNGNVLGANKITATDGGSNIIFTVDGAGNYVSDLEYITAANAASASAATVFPAERVAVGGVNLSVDNSVTLQATLAGGSAITKTFNLGSSASSVSFEDYAALLQSAANTAYAGTGVSFSASYANGQFSLSAGQLDVSEIQLSGTSVNDALGGSVSGENPSAAGVVNRFYTMADVASAITEDLGGDAVASFDSATGAWSFAVTSGVSGTGSTIALSGDGLSALQIAGSLTAAGSAGEASAANLSTITVDSIANANAAILSIDNAIEYVNSQRASLGAIQNRLDHTVSNLTNIATNTEASRSRIMDADYGAESANLARSQIIQQAATAMLAQANQSAQSVLSLLQ